MAVTEQEMLEDLAYAEAEGPADMGEEDSWDRMDMGEEDLFESESDLTDLGGEDEFDGLEAYDGLEEEAPETLGNILGAEDEDEFFGKLVRFAKKRVLPMVGKIARGAGPLLSMIPHPAAQMAGKVAGVLGKLKAEGATTEDALEAVAEVAAQTQDRRALPIVAGLAARTVLKDRAPTLSPAQRQQAARAAISAARTLVARGGPRAIRALPRIVRSVRRTAASKGTPAALRPKVLARTAAKVAQRPGLLRNLSRPSAEAQALVQRTAGSVRNIRVPSGATITITVG